MGNLKIHFTLDGVTILEPGYGSDHPLFRRPESFKAIHFAQRNAVGEMRAITFEGDDVVIELDAAQLPERIDWANLDYPSETVRDIVLDTIYRMEVAHSLEEVRSKLNDAKSAYELERIIGEVISIILAIRPKPEEKYYEHRKNDVIGSLRYTLSKEVSYAKSANQKDRVKAFDRAQSRLLSDFRFFKP